MFKKLVIAILIVVVLIATWAGWQYFTDNTAFSEKTKYLYIRTQHATYPELLQTLKDSNLIKSPWAFDLLAQRVELPQKIKPGRYELKKGMSLFDITRLLRNGTQSPVKIVITKFRTKEALAGALGKKMESDSLAILNYLNSNDSLQSFGFDTNTVMAMIYPNSYTYFWNAPIHTVFDKFHGEYKRVWTEERREQARQQGLTPVTAVIMASIVEEETVSKIDKDTIASVYLNRLRKNMKLQADPTVKFAMRNFALKRIYLKYLTTESPYNTYMVVGLPPGPICTPSIESLDAVLRSPATPYLYFVAANDFSGRHVFSATYEEHLVKAKSFQQALDIEMQKKAAAEDNIDVSK